MNHFIIFFVLISISFTEWYAKPNSAELKDKFSLENHIKSESKISFEAEVNNRGEADRPEDLTLVKKIADELYIALGKGKYPYPVKILNNSEINAATFPGGEIMVYTGILDMLSEKAKSMANVKNDINKSLGKEAESYYYTNLLAAVLAHEIGHFELKHFYRKYKAEIATNTESKKGLLALYKMSQEYETESDLFALNLLGKAGYSPEYVEKLFLLFKEMGNSGVNSYVNTHPNDYERLYKITGKANFLRYAKLVKAFDSIESGIGLLEAENILKEEIKKTKDKATGKENVYLLEALAKVYHRKWEEKCSVEKLKFKTSIPVTPFRDSMVMKPTEEAKAEGDTLCAPELHKLAMNTYEKAAERTFEDDAIFSAYLALMVYDKKQRQNAMDISLNLDNPLYDKVASDTHVLNNLGIIYYWNKDYDKSVDYFVKANNESLEQWKNEGERTQKTLMVTQKLSNRNTVRLSEALFNLGSLLYNLGIEKSESEYNLQARLLWQKYLENFETSSDWAKYALEKGNFKLSKKPKQVSVEKLSAGIPLEELKKQWGNPNYMVEGSVEGEVRYFTRWHYFSKGAIVYLLDGKVKSISLVGKKAPSILNGIKVGMKKTELYKAIGEPQQENNGIMDYFNYRMRIQINENDKIDSIGLY